MNAEINTKYYRLARKIAHGLAALEACRYVILIGSVADGTADDYSDIDLLVLYSDEPSDDAIASALNWKSIRKFWLSKNHFHAHHIIDGMKNAVLFSSANRLEGLIKRYPAVSFDEYAEISRYVVNGKVLHGDEDAFSLWQQKCRRVPEDMKRDTIHNAWAGLRFYMKEGNALSAAERSDWIMTNGVIEGAVLTILKIVYLLNDAVLIKPKRTRIELEAFPLKPDQL